MNVIAMLDRLDRLVIDKKSPSEIRSVILQLREQLEAMDKDAKSLSALKKAHTNFKRKCVDAAKKLEADHLKAMAALKAEYSSEKEALKAQCSRKVKNLEQQILSYRRGNVYRLP